MYGKPFTRIEMALTEIEKALDTRALDYGDIPTIDQRTSIPSNTGSTLQSFSKRANSTACSLLMFSADTTSMVAQRTSHQRSSLVHNGL